MSSQLQIHEDKPPIVKKKKKWHDISICVKDNKDNREKNGIYMKHQRKEESPNIQHVFPIKDGRPILEQKLNLRRVCPIK